MPDRQADLISQLKQRFTEAWEAVGGRDPEQAFEQIVSRYRSGRYYHTIDHVTEMLQTADRVMPDRPLSPECVVAVFMHDVVYDPERDDNETRSADLAKQMLADAPPDSVERIASFIEATQSHEADDPDSRLIIDLDLAPLGAPHDIFEANVKKLIEEFHHIPTRTFLLGQAGYLKRFLNRPTIYYTKPFQDEFEERARANIQRFIDTHGDGL